MTFSEMKKNRVTVPTHKGLMVTVKGYRNEFMAALQEGELIMLPYGWIIPWTEIVSVRREVEPEKKRRRRQ